MGIIGIVFFAFLGVVIYTFVATVLAEWLTNKGE
jgi:hypothetical protein